MAVSHVPMHTQKGRCSTEGWQVRSRTRKVSLPRVRIIVLGLWLSFFRRSDTAFRPPPPPAPFPALSIVRARVRPSGLPGASSVPRTPTLYPKRPHDPCRPTYPQGYGAPTLTEMKTACVCPPAYARLRSGADYAVSWQSMSIMFFVRRTICSVEISREFTGNGSVFLCAL